MYNAKTERMSWAFRSRLLASWICAGRSRSRTRPNTLRDPCAYYARCAQRFGDPFTLPTPFGPLVMTGRPEGIRTIYAAEPDSFEIFVEESQPFLGPTSVMQCNGQEHLRRRQLLNPFFTRSSLIEYFATIADAAAGFAAGLKPGDRFVAQEAMHRPVCRDVRCRSGWRQASPATAPAAFRLARNRRRAWPGIPPRCKAGAAVFRTGREGAESGGPGICSHPAETRSCRRQCRPPNAGTHTRSRRRCGLCAATTGSADR